MPPAPVAWGRPNRAYAGGTSDSNSTIGREAAAGLGVEKLMAKKQEAREEFG